MSDRLRIHRGTRHRAGRSLGPTLAPDPLSALGAEPARAPDPTAHETPPPASSPDPRRAPGVRRVRDAGRVPDRPSDARGSLRLRHGRRGRTRPLGRHPRVLHADRRPHGPDPRRHAGAHHAREPLRGGHDLESGEPRAARRDPALVRRTRRRPRRRGRGAGDRGAHSGHGPAAPQHPLDGDRVLADERGTRPPPGGRRTGFDRGGDPRRRRHRAASLGESGRADHGDRLVVPGEGHRLRGLGDAVPLPSLRGARQQPRLLPGCADRDAALDAGDVRHGLPPDLSRPAPDGVGRATHLRAAVPGPHGPEGAPAAVAVAPVHRGRHGGRPSGRREAGRDLGRDVSDLGPGGRAHRAAPQRGLDPDGDGECEPRRTGRGLPRAPRAVPEPRRRGRPVRLLDRLPGPVVGRTVDAAGHRRLSDGVGPFRADAGRAIQGHLPLPPLADGVGDHRARPRGGPVGLRRADRGPA